MLDERKLVIDLFNPPVNANYSSIIFIILVWLGFIVSSNCMKDFSTSPTLFLLMFNFSHLCAYILHFCPSLSTNCSNKLVS